jgi:hypothetical protein
MPQWLKECGYLFSAIYRALERRSERKGAGANTALPDRLEFRLLSALAVKEGGKMTH